MTGVRAATAEEVADWDMATVERRGGHVLQSLAWAEHRRATGWQPVHLVAPDGAFVLVLTRRWPLLGGGSAYIPRGPIPDVEDAAQMAGRLAAIADHLAASGIDVVASDAEVPAETGYPAAIGAIGFRRIEEIQPSRHRMAIPLGEGADEAALHALVAKSTRARIRAAEAASIVVRRFDARAPGPSESVDRVVDMPIAEARPSLDAFFDLEVATADRRGFALGPKSLFLDWWEAALRAGHLVYLEARAPADGADGPIGGLVLYRHGRRLSTVQSADRLDARGPYPGVLHLLRWRAIQQAIAERCDEMDLGGADVAGARRRPNQGEPMHGLYEHKASFGARWIELSGAHELVLRPRRYAAGRVAARLGRMAGRPS